MTDADSLFREITQLSERIAVLSEEHDRLPWDSFEERFQVKSEQRELEQRVALLHKQAAASAP